MIAGRVPRSHPHRPGNDGRRRMALGARPVGRGAVSARARVVPPGLRVIAAPGCRDTAFATPPEPASLPFLATRLTGAGG